MRALAVVHQADAGPGVFGDSLRDADVTLDVWRPDRVPAPADAGTYDAVLVFGGAAHPDEDATRPWLRAEKALLAGLIADGVPLLGVCLGSQLVCVAAGGQVRRASTPEIGFTEVELSPAAASDPLIGALPTRFDALEWHSYECLPPVGAIELARSATCLQAYRIGAAAWGIQFHAEVTLADFESWVSGYRNDPDAVRLGIDPEQLRTAALARIGAWNTLGRGLCDRFLAFAARA